MECAHKLHEWSGHTSHYVFDSRCYQGNVCTRAASRTRRIYQGHFHERTIFTVGIAVACSMVGRGDYNGSVFASPVCKYLLEALRTVRI